MKILLVSNCNTEGLKNSLDYYAPKLNVDALDINVFKKDLLNSSLNLKKYDTIIAIPEVFQYISTSQFSHHATEIKLPPFVFTAFHPDICYLTFNGKILQSKMHDYHSIIILAAFLCDIPKGKIRSLFHQEIYQKLGYFNLWDSSMEYLKKAYSPLNIDVDEWIQQRSGYYGSFMNTMNHPKIYMLSDLAQSLLKYLEISHHQCSEPPIPDNLLIGSVWPVYSEIALRYGCLGSYKFKPFACYQSFGLIAYIEDSIKLYNTVGRNNLMILKDHNYQRVENSVKIIKSIV